MSTTRSPRSQPTESRAGGHNPISEPTFLHIQRAGGGASRMVELSIGPIRIGRGSRCEVRLDDPALGEVQCILRRRGTTWQFQPVGPPGHAWIDGSPADHQCLLPHGASLRVGDSTITLRSSQETGSVWGSFETPISVEARDVTSTGASEPPAPDRSQPGPTVEENEERLRRWQARLEQRERFLKDRQDEKRWEARWKSAGESIRDRSDAPTSKPHVPPRTRPTPPPTPPQPSPRPAQTPPVSRIIEPRRAEPLRRAADPVERTSPRVPIRPISDHSPVARPARSVAPSTIPDAERPGPSPVSRSLVMLRPDESVPKAPTDSTAFEVPTAPISEIRTRTRPTPIEPTPIEPEVEAFQAAWEDSQTIDEGFSGGLIDRELEARAADELVPVGEVPSPPEDEAGSKLAVEGWAEEAHPPIAARPSTAEFPSARSIFAAQGKRDRIEPGPEVAKAARRKEPQPTDILAPAQWIMPLWLGWFPTLLVALGLGTGGMSLAVCWLTEGSGANLALKWALRPEGTTSPTIDPALIPNGAWWLSDATHLAAWAVALERSGDGEDHSAEIRSLEDLASKASRLASRSRFLVEPAAGASAESEGPDFSHLGRTRDVLSLVGTARRLRREGKVDSSLRAYRSALEIGSRAKSIDLDPPIFDENTQVLRYGLPHESLIAPVVLDLIADDKIDPDRWSEALPPSPVVSVVTMKVLSKSQKRAKADRMADLAIRQLESEPPIGFDPGEHRAAGAEALAYRGRWTDAAEQYRLAIDLASDDSTRRMWSLNLAEVAHRLNDDAARPRAIEAAKAPDSADEITRRALRMQQGPGFAAPNPRR